MERRSVTLRATARRNGSEKRSEFLWSGPQREFLVRRRRTNQRTSRKTRSEKNIDDRRTQPNRRSHDESSERARHVTVDAGET